MSKDEFTEDEMKALRRLRTLYGSLHWNNAGYFDVPSSVMLGLACRGYATTRKRSESSPREYQGKFNRPSRRRHP